MPAPTYRAVLTLMIVVGSLLGAPGLTSAADPGRPFAWGNNASGQLGYSSTTSQAPFPSSVDVSGVLARQPVSEVSAGRDHTCAVASGRAYCWGNDFFGQLGDPGFNPTPAPVAVDTSGVLTGKTITAISAGGSHTCAIAAARAYCWGDDTAGQLGDGTTGTGSTVPVPVDASGILAGKTITAISTGNAHTCAVADARAYCWGEDIRGQLGDSGATTNSPVPVPVDTAGVLAGKNVREISAGIGHTCALAAPRAYCWGRNTEGQLGNSLMADSPIPVEVSGGSLAVRVVSEVSAGGYHTCAIAVGRVSCWGRNSEGQLGATTTGDESRLPVAVDTSTGSRLGTQTVTALSAGGDHTCALAGARAYCWGWNSFGQLGNTTTADSTLPTAVEADGPLTGRAITALDAGRSHTAVLAAAVPQPPALATAIARNAAATVSWGAPADDGGSPILDYTATAAPGANTCTAVGTSCTVSGLTNGVRYTFTVTARNLVGLSAPSTPTATVIPAAPGAPSAPAKPGRVTGVKVKASLAKDRVRVAWTRAARATSYRVRLSRPGGKRFGTWKTTRRTKKVLTTDLRRGRKYAIQIRAAGPGGRGPVTAKRFRVR